VRANTAPCCAAAAAVVVAAAAAAAAAATATAAAAVQRVELHSCNVQVKPAAVLQVQLHAAAHLSNCRSSLPDTPTASAFVVVVNHKQQRTPLTFTLTLPV
jgi:hypothetical protein